MTAHTTVRRAALVFMAATLGWATAPRGPVAPAWAQAPAATAPQNTRLTQPQLEQMLAPIALYPDDLLMQVLMASTYPLEVVQAKRWLAKADNAKLKGDALTKALEKESWDPAVKSLVPFPDVLTLMNDQLDWTQNLGDAVLAQQADVFNAVQVLRGRAKAAGKLETSPQMVVAVSDSVTTPTTVGSTVVVAPPPQVITIAPAQPDVVYVPAYDPAVAYGTWPYPAQPPYYYPPPVGWGLGGALMTGLAFGVGVAAIGSLAGWASPNWGGGTVNVNANRYNNINANRGQISDNTWRHDTSHRQGVAYRDQDVANRMRGSAGAGAGGDRAQSREQFRGRAEQVQRGGGLDGAGRGNLAVGTGNRPNVGDRAGGAGGVRDGAAGSRPGGSNLANRPGGGGGNVASRPAGGAGGLAANRPAGGGGFQSQRQASGPAAFQGMGRGGDTRAAASRGSASRQQSVSARGGGGGRAAAGGGGRGGGGGGRGGGGGGRGR